MDKNNSYQRKVLFLSNTANFSKLNLPYMRWFKEQGWQVDYASAGEEEVKDCIISLRFRHGGEKTTNLC